VVRSHLLPVDPAERVHLPLRAHICRCSNTIFFSRSRIPNASDGGTRTSVSSVAPGPLGSVAVAAAASGLLLPSEVARQMRCCSTVRREFFGAHEYTCKVACDPLGVGAVPVPTCNGAKDDVWPRGGSLLLELFALRKVLLSREAGLSFARGLYAEGSGGVEGV
jgi:hypothetical protein